MGVRFPQTHNQPDFSAMRRPISADSRGAEQTQNLVQPARATHADQWLAVREVPEMNRQEEQPAIQRLAQNTGAQTPGGLIDLLA
ncbi:hypothetical protein HZA56_22300 [Candidatus Poribacteria bacterium]|nr:hypothetical protein [Candidatus Poribacteria bacterium]